jgi:hypothetical protein
MIAIYHSIHAEGIALIKEFAIAQAILSLL